MIFYVIKNYNIKKLSSQKELSEIVNSKFTISKPWKKGVLDNKILPEGLKFRVKSTLSKFGNIENWLHKIN